MTRFKGDRDLFCVCPTGWTSRRLEGVTRLKGDCDSAWRTCSHSVAALELMTRLKGDCDIFVRATFKVPHTVLELMTRLKGDCDPSSRSTPNRLTSVRR